MSEHSLVTSELERLVEEVRITTERLQGQYNKYFAGAEKRPPVFLRRELDKKIDRLTILLRQCSISASRFRAQSALTTYNSYKILWEKRLADMEKGKRQRS